jgi:hypothetical protein
VGKGIRVGYSIHEKSVEKEKEKRKFKPKREDAALAGKVANLQNVGFSLALLL